MISLNGAYHICKSVRAAAEIAYLTGYRLGKKQVVKKERRKMFRKNKYGTNPTGH